MRQYRTPEELNDVVLPGYDFCPVDARGEAIVELLCGIPDLDYRRLCERFEKIEWYLPEAKGLSEFAVFSGTTEFNLFVEDEHLSPGLLAVVIYLSPLLEEEPKDRLREIVADKIAHVMLNHEKYFDLGEETAEREAEERRRTLERWGFKVE